MDDGETKMRFAEIIREARMATLYHYMRQEKAFDVFANDAMPARWKHLIDGHEVKGNSFSRNKNYEHGSACVRLHMNQMVLAQRNKIIPLDGEVTFRHTLDKDAREIDPDHTPPNPLNFRDRKINARGMGQDRALQEEFVVGDIRPLSKAISVIEILDASFYHISGHQAVTLLDVVQEYATKHNVETIIHPRFIENVEHIKAMWAQDDDTQY